jgi:hypothetical protein
VPGYNQLAVWVERKQSLADAPHYTPPGYTLPDYTLTGYNLFEIVALQAAMGLDTFGLVGAGPEDALSLWAEHSGKGYFDWPAHKLSSAATIERRPAFQGN